MSELDFGAMMEDREVDAVEKLLGEQTICSKCGASLSTYADLCDVPLNELCHGFLTVEGARLHLRRKANRDLPK